MKGAKPASKSVREVPKSVREVLQGNNHQGIQVHRGSCRAKKAAKAAEMKDDLARAIEMNHFKVPELLHTVEEMTNVDFDEEQRTR